MAILLALIGAIVAFNWQAPATQSDIAANEAGFTDREKAAIEAIVRDYILHNPEIIPEAVAALDEKRSADKIASQRAEIFEPFPGAVAGNPQGDVTLVEFSDYACGYCRRSVEDVHRLLENDDKVKIVFRELPILSDDSTEAAKMALAAAEQGKYYAFHNALFANGGASSQAISNAARTAGLDMARAKSFIAKPMVEEELSKNLEIAQRLEISGTPSWVVGDELLVGAVGYQELRAAVQRARAARDL